MSGVILINALGILAAILILLFFKLSDADDKKHFLLQILFLGFIMIIVVLIGKSAVDYKDNCAWLVKNDTLTGNTTSYTYDYICDPDTNGTADTFYKVTVWIMRITGIYLFLYLLVESILAFGKWKRGDQN